MAKIARIKRENEELCARAAELEHELAVLRERVARLEEHVTRPAKTAPAKK